MWAATVVEGHISTDPEAGVGHGFIGVKVDLLVFDRSPEPFDEDVVPPSSFAVHRDADFGILQLLDEVEGCELATLVRIKDFGFAVARQRLLDRLDAERRLQRDRQLS
jgi:hypothetical protein